VLIAPIDELAEGVARIDARQAQKNPDWSYGGVESGRWPANAIDVDEEAEAEAERAQGPD
jgi:hypothetical protein